MEIYLNDMHVCFFVFFNKFMELTHISIGRADPGSKMTISGRPEIGRQDVLIWLAAHPFDVIWPNVWSKF